MCRFTRDHEAFKCEGCCGRYVDLLAATAQEVLLLAPSVHSSYAELATCAEEVQRSPQLLQVKIVVVVKRQSSHCMMGYVVPDQCVYALI